MKGSIQSKINPLALFAHQTVDNTLQLTTIANLGGQAFSPSDLSPLSNLTFIWLNLPGTTALVRIAHRMIDEDTQTIKLYHHHDIALHPQSTIQHWDD